MIEAETALLFAVQKRLADALELDPNLIQVEIDDEAPAVTGDLYFCVQPAGIQPGPRHSTSGTVWDLQISIRVAVMMRVAKLARDRRRQAYLERARGMNAHLKRVIDLLDFDYTVLELANEFLVDPDTRSDIEPETADEGKFLEPLRFATMDSKPRTIDRTPYDASDQTVMSGFQPPAGDPVLGMLRGINFARARFLRERYPNAETL